MLLQCLKVWGGTASLLVLEALKRLLSSANRNRDMVVKQVWSGDDGCGMCDVTPLHTPHVPSIPATWYQFQHCSPPTLCFHTQSLSVGLPALLLEILDWRAAGGGGRDGHRLGQQYNGGTTAALPPAGTTNNDNNAATDSTVSTTLTPWSKALSSSSDGGGGSGVISQHDLGVMRVVAVEVIEALMIEGAYAAQVSADMRCGRSARGVRTTVRYELSHLCGERRHINAALTFTG